MPSCALQKGKLHDTPSATSAARRRFTGRLQTFFNFDEQALNEPIARFLRERYPKRSRFEKE
ncbi:MAG TPA: hypothetical protein VG056_03340 [Pirellulales bacterium]|nr:hypothetical protein [Pirellulales bacterium]